MKTYGNEILIENVASDSTFVAKITDRLTGSIPDQDRSGCQIAIRAVGNIDDSTKVMVNYFNRTYLFCSLPKGKIDTVWGGDFYTSTARVTFLHQNAKRGSLKLSIEFSSPPKEWNRQANDGG